MTTIIKRERFVQDGAAWRRAAQYMAFTRWTDAVSFMRAHLAEDDGTECVQVVQEARAPLVRVRAGVYQSPITLEK